MDMSRNATTVAAPATIGFLTGVVTLLVQPFGGPLIDPIEAIVRDLDMAWLEGTVLVVLTFGPGFLFGAAVGAWLHLRETRAWWRWAVLTAAATASWYLGVRAAIEVFDVADTEWVALGIGGAAGGLVGAAVFGAGAMLAYPAARDRSYGVVTIVVGTLAGALLAVRTGDHPMVVFPVWQALVAAVLGRAMTRSQGVPKARA